MKKLVAVASLLATLALVSTAHAQGCANPNSTGIKGAQTNGCGGGNPHPGPGTNPNPGYNPTLNWVNQGNPNYGVYVGGTIDREQVGAAINPTGGGTMYVAVASRTNDDGAGNHAVTLYTNTTGGNDLTLVGNIAWNYGAPGAAGTQAYSSVNPKLVFVKQGPTPAQLPRIYLALTVGNSFTIGYLDYGSTFKVLLTNYGGVIGAPGLADFDGNNLAIGYVSTTSAGARGLVVQVYDYQGNLLSGGSDDYADIGFDPGMVVANGTLYIAAQNYNSHQIALWSTTDGGTTLVSSIRAGNDTTSTTPSLVTRNGYLYIGFRTNDGDHKFLYKYSTDAYNWTTEDPHYEMGGPPNLMVNPNATQYVPALAGAIFNAFGAAQSNRPYTLAYAQ